MRFLYFLISFLFLPFTLWPCSCVDIKTFCETITYGSGAIDPDLIILGEKRADNEAGMVVEVMDVLHGAETSASITVLRGNGADCMENTDRFQVGEQLILALYGLEGSPATYRLFICGVNYLQVDDDKVKGAIAPGINSLRYNKFRQLDRCGFQPVGNLAELFIFPNPARQQLFLGTQEPGRSLQVTVRVRDLLGRQIGGSQTFNLDEKTYQEIPIGHLNSGMYVLEAIAGQERRLMKVVVGR